MIWVRSVEDHERAAREWAKNAVPVASGFFQPGLAINLAINSITERARLKFEQRQKDFRRWMLAFPTKTQLRILACLIDDRGHPQWEIAEELRIDKGYISSAVNGLKDHEIVYRGADRLTTNRKTRSPNRHEHPLYINKDPDIIFKLNNHVEMKLEHLGRKAPKTLKLLSKWLKATVEAQEACLIVGERVRIDPKPLTDKEIKTLSLGLWPPDWDNAMQEVDKMDKRLSEAMEEPK